MKKSLLALAVLGTLTGAASAQSNVTVYGLIDIGLTHFSSDIAGTRVGLDSGIWNGSRLGFRGTEDLGGGLSVNFLLENGFGADTGALLQGGRLFGRQSWVGVKGGFGELRFGRQWIPAYTQVFNVIDPFGDGLAGASGRFFGRNIFNAIDVRMQNAIDYSVVVGGLKAEVAYGLGEEPGDSSANRQLGAAFTYATGPLKVAVGYHNINDAAGTGSAKLAFVGGNYNFGPATLHLAVDKQENDAAGVTTLDASDLLVGLTVPVGAAGKVLASYNRWNDKSAANADSKQYAVAYTHDLSKRTSLYTSYGHISTADTNRFNVGIRHKF